MKVLITGASGLLGRAVVRNFKAAGHSVVGTAYSRANDELIKLDLTDSEQVEKLLNNIKPEVIVHCAAERRPDVAEKDHEGTLKLNAKVPGDLALYAKIHGVMLIYISTDYVFNGTNPPYQADDLPDPINFYGESKLAGEQAIRDIHPASVILRVPILYGDVLFNGESAVNLLIDSVKNTNKPAEMDNYCLRYPTNVDDVGRVIKDLAVYKIEKGRSIEGTYHFTAEEMLTKYDMCCIFADLLNVSKDHLQPQNSISGSASASRPKDCHLSTTRLQTDGIDVSFVPFRTWFQSYLSP
ncbi:uncharacterized protein BX664DRAFT_335555 [Halteromyces radiatus]|uniref:uncharacterized protein n=1 Tax=Halteromyces radiatus TaxID=101107 RepID=UPI00221E3A6D|nr:uncharacterized protein BX664DRAFT_335555 [Halteromyces radiatus]KAI8086339.1 hypothetical protein BX664DRAFT_335555 [Halteromyces radiatus]